MEEEEQRFFLVVAVIIGGFYVATRSHPNVVFAFYLAMVASGCAATAMVWVGRGMTPPHRMGNPLFIPLGLMIPFMETGFGFARPELFWLTPLALALLNLHGRTSVRPMANGKTPGQETAPRPGQHRAAQEPERHRRLPQEGRALRRRPNLRPRPRYVPQGARHGNRRLSRQTLQRR